MNDTYSAYLQSQAWEAKRKQRMGLSGFACEACGTKSRLQVHHLTYERIFQEDMADLMTLCRIHHEAAEEMVKKGALKRTGCVKQLRSNTLALVAPRKGFVKRSFKATNGKSTRKPRVRDSGSPLNVPAPYRGLDFKSTKAEVKSILDADPEFQKLLSLPPERYRKVSRKMFGKFEARGRILSVASQIFQDHLRGISTQIKEERGATLLGLRSSVLDRIFAERRKTEVLALYLVYATQSVEQSSTIIHFPTSAAANATQFNIPKTRRAKKRLLEMGLIRELPRQHENGKFTEPEIEVLELAPRF